MMFKRILTLCAVLAVLVPAQTNAAQVIKNEITITEQEGKTTKNYPIQIGRPFVQGEIVNAPIAIVDGVVVPTQADIKTRYADGTVQYAVIAFLVPTLKANSKTTVSFQN